MIRRLPGPTAVLGEGPTYDIATDSLWWFDILGQRLFEHRFVDDQTKVHDLPFMASALARIDEYRQLLVTEQGLVIRDIASGRLDPHLVVEGEPASNRSNDARTHPSGALWFGTMGKAAQSAAGAIYWYRKGELRRLYQAISIPNAICFTPGGDRAFFVDTKIGDVWTVAVDPSNGLPLGDRNVFVSSLTGADGAVVDKVDNLYVARWGGSQISVHSAAGRHLHSLAVPTEQPSCPAFFGPSLDRIAVTSASLDLIEDDAAGATFVLEVRVAGITDAEVLV